MAEKSDTKWSVETAQLPVSTDLRNPFPDAVVIVTFNEKFDKILLEKEFRLPVGDYIYNFPAGLMEDGQPPHA